MPAIASLSGSVSVAKELIRGRITGQTFYIFTSIPGKKNSVLVYKVFFFFNLARNH